VALSVVCGRVSTMTGVLALLFIFLVVRGLLSRWL